MADLGKIQFKRSATAGSKPTGLSAGELAMNIKDARLFSSDGTNIIEFGLSKGGTIDGTLNITGDIKTSGGGVIAHQDGNVYLNKSGATGWIDALFLRKDISNTMNGSFTATGQIAANSGMITSNDSNHYINLGKIGTNNYSFGNYDGTFSFIDTHSNGNVLSLTPSTASFSSGTGKVSLGSIIFNGTSTGTNSNNDYARGVGFNIESVDTSNSNYPDSMGTLMTSVLSNLRIFQLFATSGNQGLYYRTMRNDGSGTVAWNQLYSTANKPGPSDVGAYSTSQSDSLFAPKANFLLSGTDAHMKGTGSTYLFMNGNGTSGAYGNSKTLWGFDANGNMTSGLIPIANGGTGATNASSARNNLGLGNGAVTTYAIPGNSSAKNSWLYLCNVKASGSNSARVSCEINGLGNFGNGLSEVNYLEITGRFATNGNGTLPVQHRRIAGGTTDTLIGYKPNKDTNGVITSYDIYIKDTSGWISGAQISITSTTNLNLFSGPIINGAFSAWTSTDPTGLFYAQPLSTASSNYDGSSVINGEFISYGQNGLRIATDNSSSSSAIILRNDGINFNFLISNNGIIPGNNWNASRPLSISLNNGSVLVGNGLTSSAGINVTGGNISSLNSIYTTGDNSGLVIGNNADVGILKKNGNSGKFVFGKNNSFVVAQSTNATISATDTMNNVFSVDGSGATHVFGTLQTDGAATFSSGATVATGLNVNAAANITDKLTVGNRATFNGGVTINNGFTVGSSTLINNSLTVNGTSTLVGAVTTNSTVTANGNILSQGGYLFTSGGLSSSFLPGTQGAYIGWNFPSGRGQTVLINHKGGGNGGFTFYNSDGKTNTQLADINGSGDLNISGKLVGKDTNHYLDMTSDTYTLGNYGGQFYFKNTNGNAQAELSYSGNIMGSQWGGKWLSDYMNSTYANVTGQTFTGAINLANNTWNNFGDDVKIGDRNIPGKLAIGALNTGDGSTGLAFFTKSNTSSTPSATITATAGQLSLDTATIAKNGFTTNALNVTGTVNTIGLTVSGTSTLMNVNSSSLSSTGNLTINGTGSFGGSLGAAGLNSSAGMTINGYSNLNSGANIKNGLTVSGTATYTNDIITSGTTTFGGTIEANGQVNINNNGLVVKNGVNAADSSGNYYTSGYRISGREGQFVDTYYQEITGQYAFCGVHVSSGGSDGWFQFKNNGDIITNGGLQATHAVINGTSITDTNGGIGAYVFASTLINGHKINYGDTIAGSNIHSCCISSSIGTGLDNVSNIHYGGTLPGTWRCCGTCIGSYYEATIFQRIA